MKNQFGKTRPHDSPYAIYQGEGGFEWRVLKTYRSVENEKKDKYARWFVRGKLVDATPEWRDAYSH